MSTPAIRRTLDRRRFLQASATAAGGFLVAAVSPWPLSAQPASSGTGPSSWAPSVFVELRPDNSCLVTIPVIEIGQGVRTTFARVVAAELGLSSAQVDVRQAPYNPAYGNQNVGGSQSIRRHFVPMRKAAAAAREALLTAARERFGEDADLIVGGGSVIARESGRRLPFTALLARAAALPVPTDPPLRPRDELRFDTTPTVNVDLTDVVTGQAVYGQDYRVLGARVAVITRCPFLGGRVGDYDARAALEVPGVLKVIALPGTRDSDQVPAGVAVVAAHTWAALEGRKRLEVTWKGAPRDPDATEASIEQDLIDLVSTDQRPVQQRGEGAAALAGNDRRLDATYTMQILAHAPLEPQSCTAHVHEDGRVELWATAQFPGGALRDALRALGRDPDEADDGPHRLEVLRAGGGFGRRINTDMVVEAALLSAAAGHIPVQVLWTREDDMRHGFYRPATAMRLTATLDADGNPRAWRHRLASTAIRATTDGPEAEGMERGEFAGGSHSMAYLIPHLETQYAFLNPAFRRGWWRGVAHVTNGFAVESFMDECAHAAGVDPLAYRRRLLAARGPVHTFPNEWAPQWNSEVAVGRLRAVLERAAAEAGWGQPLPAGHAHGLALCNYHECGSFSAAVAEVSIKDGQIQVHKIDIAVDCGLLINASGGRAQIEGGAIWGLSQALYEKIHYADGRIREGNYHDYRIVRMPEAPRVHTHFVASEEGPGGLGEPGVPPVAPAIANAVFALTGKRLRSLPLRLDEADEA